MRALTGLVFFLFYAFCWASLAAASESHMVTIKEFEMKDEDGRWVSIVRPDRQVDLAREEAAVSFFNNGRIPNAKYVNLRVRLLAPEFLLSGKRPAGAVAYPPDAGPLRDTLVELKEGTGPFEVKKGTFLNVTLDIDFDRARIKNISFAVDAEIKRIGGEDVRVEALGESAHEDRSSR